MKTAPRLTKTQDDVTVDPDDGVTLSCAASGSPTPLINWYRDGMLISGGVDGFLHLSYLRRSANYTCEAVNAAGRDESTMRLTVRRKFDYLHAHVTVVCIYMLLN